MSEIQQTINISRGSDLSNKEPDSYVLLKNFNQDEEETNSEIPRETLRSVYGNDFEDLAVILKNEEDNNKLYFHEIMTGLEERYQQFNINMNTHFIDLTNKITEAFKIDNNSNIQNNNLNNQNAKSALIQKYSREYIERIKKIINMHRQISDCIKETISILFNFLDISKSLDKEKPIQEFLGKEFKKIIKSWMFLKLDIEKFDFAQALNESDLDNNFKNFIFKICQGKNFVMNMKTEAGAVGVFGIFRRLGAEYRVESKILGGHYRRNRGIPPDEIIRIIPGSFGYFYRFALFIFCRGNDIAVKYKSYCVFLFNRSILSRDYCLAEPHSRADSV